MGFVSNFLRALDNKYPEVDKLFASKSRAAHTEEVVEALKGNEYRLYTKDSQLKQLTDSFVSNLTRDILNAVKRPDGTLSKSAAMDLHHACSIAITKEFGDAPEAAARMQEFQNVIREIWDNAKKEPPPAKSGTHTPIRSDAKSGTIGPDDIMRLGDPREIHTEAVRIRRQFLAGVTNTRATLAEVDAQFQQIESSNTFRFWVDKDQSGIFRLGSLIEQVSKQFNKADPVSPELWSLFKADIRKPLLEKEYMFAVHKIFMGRDRSEVASAVDRLRALLEDADFKDMRSVVDVTQPGIDNVQNLYARLIKDGKPSAHLLTYLAQVADRELVQLGSARSRAPDVVPGLYYTREKFDDGALGVRINLPDFNPGNRPIP